MSNETFLVSELSLLLLATLLSLLWPRRRYLPRGATVPAGEKEPAPLRSHPVPGHSPHSDKALLELINAKTPNWPRKEVI